MGRRAVPPLLALVLTAACTGGDTPAPGGRPGAPTFHRGGTLRIVEPGPAAFVIPLSYESLSKDFDPQRSYWGTAWELFRCCLLRTLVSYDVGPASRGKVVVRPDLAAAQPQVSSDGLTWTFRMREGLHYGPPLDDVPIVAGDIVRGLQRTADPDVASEYSFYYSIIRGFEDYQAGRVDSISGLEVPDERTLVIHLTRPAGDLPHLLALPGAAPIPPNPNDPSAAGGVATGHRTYGPFLVSSGPYVLEGSEDLNFSVPPEDQQPVEGFVPGESITLVRNPSWDPGSDPLRPAFADRIEVTIGGSREDVFRAVESGQADLPFQTLAGVDARIRAFRGDPELEDRIHIDPGNSTIFVSMNLAMPPFDDIHVRKAVNYVIDKDGLVPLAERFEGTVLDPVNRVATHMAPDVMENQLLLGYDPYPTPGSRGSVRLAQAEMRQSRYDTTGDGICDHPSCRGIVAPANIHFVGEAGAASVASDLRGVGLQVRPELLPFPEISPIVEDTRARVALIIGRGWLSDYPNASTFFVPLFSRAGLGHWNNSLVGASPEQLRRWGYTVQGRVPSLDGRIAECQALLGPEQVDCWARLDKHLMEEVVPAVPLISGQKASIVSARVARYSFDPFTLTPALDQIALEPQTP